MPRSHSCCDLQRPHRSQPRLFGPTTYVSCTDIAARRGHVTGNTRRRLAQCHAQVKARASPSLPAARQLQSCPSGIIIYRRRLQTGKAGKNRLHCPVGIRTSRVSLLQCKQGGRVRLQGDDDEPLKVDPRFAPKRFRLAHHVGPLTSLAVPDKSTSLALPLYTTLPFRRSLRGRPGSRSASAPWM